MNLVGNVHLVKGTEESIPAILAMLREQKILSQDGADLYKRIYNHFGIDEARELRERAISKSMGGGRRVFLVVVPGLTVEAQNALLKTLEEPPANAFFCIALPSPDTLLTTLRSRSQMLVIEGSESVSLVDVQKFLASPPKARLDMLKPLFEKGDDDRRDAGAVLTFLSALESSLNRQQDKRSVKEGIEAIYRARMYVADKGSLIKPLLEQVALLA